MRVTIIASVDIHNAFVVNRFVVDIVNYTCHCVMWC